MNFSDNYNNILVIRPLVNDMVTDINEIPVIKKTSIDNYFLNKLEVTNFKNLNSIKYRRLTIIDSFNDDYVLARLWNDPLKYVSKFSELFAVASPDFSVYPEMNRIMILNNIFKSRWIGAFWQSFGVNVIPTITWALEDTYDICFSGVEKNGIVIISTLGVSKNYEIFIKGFNEMKKRLNPQIIIVIGKLYPDMEGNFLHYTLNDTFNPKKKVQQLRLFRMAHHIIKSGGEISYGW